MTGKEIMGKHSLWQDENSAFLFHHQIDDDDDNGQGIMVFPLQVPPHNTGHLFYFHHDHSRQYISTAFPSSYLNDR